MKGIGGNKSHEENIIRMQNEGHMKGIGGHEDAEGHKGHADAEGRTLGYIIKGIKGIEGHEDTKGIKGMQIQKGGY